MLAVIWGHTKLTGLSNEFVYAFHIPLFFFMSGMVFSSSRYADFKEFVRRKVKTLLVPYVIYSVMTWVLWAGYSYVTHASVHSYWMPLLQTFLAQGSGGFLEHNVPLWFVTCLFMVEMEYWFVSKLSDGWNIIVSIGCALLGYILVYHCDFWNFKLLPWSIEVSMMALIFYSAGNLMIKKWSHRQIMDGVTGAKVRSWLLVTAGMCATAWLAHYEGAMSMGHANLGKNPLVFYVTAFIGIASSLVLCILLADIDWRGIWKRLAEGIKWFGRNSFDAMAIHNPIRAFIIVIVARLFATNSDAVSASNGLSLISFITTLIVTSACMVVIGRIRKSLKGKPVQN